MIDLIPAKYRLAAALIGIAIACAASAVGAWTARGWKEDAARLDAERQALAEYLKLAGIYGDALNQANAERDQSRQQAAADRETFKKERQHAKPLAYCGPGLTPGRHSNDRSHAVFSAEYVRLRNLALQIGLPAALRPAGDHRLDSTPEADARN